MSSVSYSISFLLLLLLFTSCKESTAEGVTVPTKSIKHPRLSYEEYKDTKWYSYYSRNKLDSAQVALEEHLLTHPDELPTLTMYAELLRRQKEYERADNIASKILKLDSCAGNAWQVKGDIRNPQYGKNPVQDSADKEGDFYYSEGIKRDSTNGNLWEVAIFRALERGDQEEFKRGLHLLYAYGHYTKKALARARLELKQLPENAMLITAGDMDTYPLLAVQEGEGLRKDVTVLNYSMANIPWYINQMCSFSGLRLPITKDEIDNLKVKLTPQRKSRYKTIAKQLLDTLAKTEKRGFPLCVVANMPPGAFEGLYKVTKGHHVEIVTEQPKSWYDPEAMLATREFVDCDSLAGDFISPQENSPLILNVNNYGSVDMGLLWPYIIVAAEKFKADDSTYIELEEWIISVCDVTGNRKPLERLYSIKDDFRAAKEKL